MIKKIVELKIFKYLFVGICTVVIDYIIIFLIYSLLEINYIVAICSGFLASNVFQFYMNFFYTFSLKKDNLINLKMVVFWIAVAIGNGIAFLFIVGLKLFISDVFIVKTISLPLSFLYGYIVSRKVIYNPIFYNYLQQRIRL